MSNLYVDGISDKVSHRFASSLTVDLITVGEDTATISVVCPDRWFLGDYAVVTSRDGEFAGEIEGMDVCTGEVTIRGVGQMSARITPLPGHRARPGCPYTRTRGARHVPRVPDRNALSRR